MRKQRNHQEDTSEVDMTPMLDIVFIMLIFFIVTTSFIKESGIDIQRPEKLPNKLTEITKTLVIKIDEFEDITMASRIIQQDAVESNVQAALSENPDVSIIVAVAENVDTGILVDVVDQVKSAGIAKVTVSEIKG